MQEQDAQLEGADETWVPQQGLDRYQDRKDARRRELEQHRPALRKEGSQLSEAELAIMGQTEPQPAHGAPPLSEPQVLERYQDRQPTRKEELEQHRRTLGDDVVQLSEAEIAINGHSGMTQPLPSGVALARKDAPPLN